jgi:hypothetical protein
MPVNAASDSDAGSGTDVTVKFWMPPPKEPGSTAVDG